jgi:hypothetical protein
MARKKARALALLLYCVRSRTGRSNIMKRRRFLQTCAGLLTAGGFSAANRSEAARQLDIRAVAFSAGLSRARFEALLGETFYIHTPTQGTLIVRLASVRRRSGAARPEQFSLFFQADPLPKLTAGSYQVEHYLAGRIALYLEPVPGARYRADFSLL